MKFQAKFFNYIQNAAFYEAAHKQAVNMVKQKNQNQTWIDIGCGAGIVAKLAAIKGYNTTGYDINPEMVNIAIKNNFLYNLKFRECDFNFSNIEQADVVSAASLLITSNNQKQMLEKLHALVKPNGKLIIIETTKNMKLSFAIKQFFKTRGKRAFILLLWAFVRGGKTVDESIFDGYVYKKCSILNSMICARIIEK